MKVPQKKVLRIMIVDRSKVARSLISRILKREIKSASIVTCGSAEEAMNYLQQEKFDLITTAVVLPGLDGFELCHEIRKNDMQRITPVIVVSSDANMSVLHKGFDTGVTDYFNKSLGHDRLVKFIKEIAQRQSSVVGRVLYVENHNVPVTQTALEMHGLYITHVKSGEEALDLLKKTAEKFDIVFTDYFLEGKMTGGNLLQAIRSELNYSREEMPVLLIEKDQTDIHYMGANDFIRHPIIEEVLIARLTSLLLIKHQYKLIKRYSQNLYKLQITDSLTGLYNKNFLFEEGKKFLAQSQEICLMMIDLDDFEKFNEMQGYLVGDRILRIIGQFFLNFFPKKMLVARFSGKKFTVLISDCNVIKGKVIAEKLRLQMMKLKPESVEITVSIGLAFSEGVNKVLLSSLISDAETALRTAYQQGHNCTCLCVTNKNIFSASN